MMNLIIGKVSEDSFYEIFEKNSNTFNNLWLSTINSKKIIRCIKEITSKELWSWRVWNPENAWFLHGEENITGSSFIAENAIAYSSPNSLLETEEKCKYFYERFKWSLIPWPNTFSCKFMAFITSDDSIFENVKMIFKKLSIHISDYKAADSFYNMFNTATFGVYGKEGDFPWNVALDEGVAPIVICDKSDGVPRIERFIFSKVECLYEDLKIYIEPYRSLDLSFYRINDYRLYRKLWERSNEDNHTIKYAISGSSNIKELKEVFLDSSSPIHSLDEFKEIKYLSDLCGWVYKHSYGGGSNEYYAWFSANTPNITSKIIEQVETQKDWRGYFCGLF